MNNMGVENFLKNGVARVFRLLGCSDCYRKTVRLLGCLDC